MKELQNQRKMEAALRSWIKNKAEIDEIQAEIGLLEDRQKPARGFQRNCTHNIGEILAENEIWSPIFVNIDGKILFLTPASTTSTGGAGSVCISERDVIFAEKVESDE